MSGGVLVLGEGEHGRLRAGTNALLEAARSLAEQGAGPVSLAVIDADADAVLAGAAARVAGVRELIAVPSPHGSFEAHVSQAALEGLIEAHRPAIVLAGHTVDSLGFLAAVAARGRHGFASDVTRVSFQAGGLHAWRGDYGERLLAELDFPAKKTVLLALRAGAFATRAPSDGAPAPGGEAFAPRVSRLELALAGRMRSERIELRASAGEPDIDRAEVLLGIGRGIGGAEAVPRLERLASRLGAALVASGAPVEAGWVSRTRKIGQSGRTVAPRVYLALGISGAPQHLAGIAGATTIIAINTDPNARIFDVADHGAVADLFEVAAELERQLG
ncbi:MAG TPA: electron transfer flavoprotein subunit alpha/FixB family protein [Solirubrobacteraceae bacterium]|nr:electron transfer flavoprotein subunit alpha/FixB family protein [Solirubrobacteraceae bacterium]